RFLAPVAACEFCDHDLEGREVVRFRRASSRQIQTCARKVQGFPRAKMSAPCEVGPVVGGLPDRDATRRLRNYHYTTRGRTLRNGNRTTHWNIRRLRSLR